MGSGTPSPNFLQLTERHATDFYKRQQRSSLGTAAASLRSKLGESLASIQKYATPVEQATTSSLDALKAATQAEEIYNTGRYTTAVPLWERAIELDPNFALAYEGLAGSYGNMGESEKAIEYEKKAFALRERVSERERFRIIAGYCWEVTGNLNKEMETEEAWREAYPHDGVPSNNLAVDYFQIGQMDKAVEFGEESIHSQNTGPGAYIITALAYLALNRIDEAKSIMRESLARRPDDPDNHQGLYLIALVEGDEQGMQHELQAALGKAGEEGLLGPAAANAAQHGRLEEARRLFAQGVESTRTRGFREVAAGLAAAQALVEAEVGNFAQARDQLGVSFALARSRTNLGIAAVAAAFTGDTAQVESAIAEVRKRYPEDTVLQSVYLPSADAVLKVNRSRPADAVTGLQAAKPYELGSSSTFLPIYIRGLAYLRAQQGTDAAREFQNILDHRNNKPEAPEAVLSYLGLARAYNLGGDASKSRKAYQEFLALWKDADPDIPILKQAKAEYARLQ
jgi:eukaryotic-like serine/threonine-protein kinase